MNHLKTLVIAFVMTLVASSAFSATYYGSADNCEAAWHAGLAEGYQPTAKHKGFGDARVAGLEKRKLEGDACVLLGAQPGRRWVFLKQGTSVYTKGAELKMLGECQNDIYQFVYLKKEELAPPVKVVEQQTTTMKTKVIQLTEVDNVIVCREPNGNTVRPKEIGGKLTCPVAEVHVPVVVVPEVKVQSAQVTAPPQAATSSCTDCAPMRKTEAGNGAVCRFKDPSNRSSIECNFEWKVLHTQDQIRNCGCQILIPQPRQIIGFMDAQPGSVRCLQQKRLWAETLGLRYNDSRPSQ